MRKSCFACCPPIRPAGYEHIQYARSLERLLRENTTAYKAMQQGLRPITGLSCWALGYLDDQWLRVGCLLHPFQNNGQDLRWQVDYGEKCRREECVEARLFRGLSVPARSFWLQPASDLNSFSYSSRRYNPLFKLLGWGRELLEELAAQEGYCKFTKQAFFRKYPFFLTPLQPRAHAYLLHSIVLGGRGQGLLLLRDPRFGKRFEDLARQLKRALNGLADERESAPFTHNLPMHSGFLDFLRLGVGLRRIYPEQALGLKSLVDGELLRFREAVGRLQDSFSESRGEEKLGILKR